MSQRQVDYLPRTITTFQNALNPIMHKHWYIKYLVLLTDMKQPLVYVNSAISMECTLRCAVCGLKYSHAIDSEASDSLRVTCTKKQ